MGKQVIDELEVFNSGLGVGLELGERYAWVKTNHETGEVPDIDEVCIGLWVQKRLGSAPLRAECFRLEETASEDGEVELVGIGESGDLKSFSYPDFWTYAPNLNDC